MPDPFRSPVVITAELDEPVVLNIGGDPAKRFRLACDVTFTIGDYARTIKQGYEFDGPSIPRPFWWIAGLSPADIDTALASCIHDFACEHPELVPRIIGDGIFFLVLGPVVFNGRALIGVGAWRREAMYIAVRVYSRLSGKDWT